MLKKATAPNKKAFKTDDQVPELHAETHEFIVVKTQQMEWTPAPAKGIWRKRLMVIPGEPTQLTTLVKFEPGRVNEHLSVRSVEGSLSKDDTTYYYC